MSGIQVEPMDAYNRALVDNVHPDDWPNPAPAEMYNLVVMGAGAGGLVAALGAAAAGAKVALVEMHLLGGDCLNVGCVPSKAIIRSSRVAALMRAANDYGIHKAPGKANFGAVMERMRRLRSRISPIDSARRLTAAGVDVFFGRGEFIDAQTLRVGEQRLRFARAVLATGSRPARPEVEGLAEVGYHTN